ncbi:MAG: hypothetical protein HY917_02655 [Candidatus Diapherotrites archaeon]|nr:hypothetical protein [Candidatus Diapherotrites archaeon]
MNARGQEFAPFEMLVHAIIGLSILAIVVSAISYFEAQKTGISRSAFEEKVSQAVHQVNGDVFVIESVLFEEGSISSRSLEVLTGLNAECFSFESKAHPSLDTDGSIMNFRTRVTLDVFMRCCPGSSLASGPSASCPVFCTVSFGQPLQSGACTGS